MLKGRLKELAACHAGERIIWDVGCDHAQLGLSFLQDKAVDEIHLVDPSLDVIDTLKASLLDSYISSDKIFIHHKKGQEIRLDRNQNKIFVAGMGGKEIIDILMALEPQSDFSFSVTVSPHKNVLELREYLRRSTYRLKDEFLIHDLGRFYQVLTLDFDQTHGLVSLYGSDLWQDPEAPQYRDYLTSVYRSHMAPKDQDYLRFLESLSFS